MGTNAVLALLGLCSAAVAARLLGVSGRGELAAIQVTAAFVSLIGFLGMPDAVVYWSAKHRSRSGNYLATAVLVALAGSSLAAVLALPVIPLLLDDYGDSTVSTARLFLLSAPILAVVHVSTQSLRGRQAFVPWNACRLLYAGAWLAAVVAAGTILESDVRGVSYAYLVALFLLVPVVAVVAARQLPGALRPSRTVVDPLLRFGLPSVGASLPQMLNLRLDQLVLANVVAARDLGLYAAAVGWSWAVNPFLQAIALVTFPSVATLGADDQRGAVLRSARLGGAAAAAVGIVVGALTPVAMSVLYGDAFTDAVPVAMLLVGAGCLFGWAYILEEGARGLGLPKIALRAEIIGLVVTVATILATVGSYGIRGAALASCLGYASTLALMLFGLRRHLVVPIASLVMPRRADLAAVVTSLRRLR